MSILSFQGGAKLIAKGDDDHACIQVSGDDNSLTIYAESKIYQMGKLEATGGQYAAGIGGGNQGSSSNIKVATTLIVKAGDSVNPTMEIASSRAGYIDIASVLAGKRYTTTEVSFPKYKPAAIAAVNAEIAESDNDNVKAIATNAVAAINAVNTTNANTAVEVIDAIKAQAIAAIASARAAYTDGQTVLDNMDTLCTDCNTVEVIDGTTTVKLFNPTKVSYIKK